jgi:hypothetical protein
VSYRSNSDLGMAVGFPAAAESYLVSPATGPEKNTLRAGLFPVGCWRLDDPCFPFGSSFVVPDARPEFTELGALMREHPGAPLSLFGHADPVGDEEYNKILSGRRAKAVYAVLLRNTSMWEQLFSQPHGNDNWRDSAVPQIRTALGESGSGDGTSASRAALFRRYMDWLSSHADGTPFQLQASDFLGEGSDAGGKGDYQGCSEFNPVLVFSKADSDRYANDEDKTERNSANAPNRRVSALLFRPGTRIDPAKWPCPRATESAAGCRKRFWSDHQARVAPRTEKRQWEKTKDTFGCRFYDRIAGDSPCERVAANAVVIQLLYEDETPMANATFEAVFGETKISGKTDATGTAAIEPPEGEEGPFRLFLLDFAEQYVVSDAEPAASTADAAPPAGGEGTKIAARHWPNNVFASLLLALSLSLDPARAAGLPPVEATLAGPLYATGEPGTITINLHMDPRSPAGTVEYPTGVPGKRFTMIDVVLEVLEEHAGEGTQRARYRLRYTVDQCENTQPLKDGVNRWNPCDYRASETRPKYLVQAEALITRERREDGEFLVAAGVPDARNLWGVYRATGRASR